MIPLQQSCGGYPEFFRDNNLLSVKKEREFMNKKISCYDCIHNCVCKYWLRWQDTFPYMSDDHIKSYLIGLTETLANACAHFEKRVLK